MKIARQSCWVGFLLFLTTTNLPAPVSEVETPRPTAAESAKPKKMHKNVSHGADASIRGQASTQKADPSTNCKNFDGKWTGTLNCGQFGAVQFTDVISDSGTSLEWSASN